MALQINGELHHLTESPEDSKGDTNVAAKTTIHINKGLEDGDQTTLTQVH